MTALVAVVLAPPLEGYRRIRTAPEPELFPPRQAVVRREPCACGSDVVQRAGEDVPAAVSAHNGAAAHRAWRARGGL